jgi:D-alanine--poly(phosphoribitol) ligase subunit 1
MNYNFHKKQFEDILHEPEKLAVSGSDKDISWFELKTRVEFLSFTLSQLQIPKGSPVIIYGHKETFFAEAILACIHSSITYIPIDKIYPDERVEYIINHTAAQVLINCTGHKLPFDCAVEIDREIEVIKHKEPEFIAASEFPEDDPLQYIMFTSGSTGQPKGVQIRKKSTLAFIDWSTKEFGFTSDDVFMNQAPFSFDVSLCDLFNAFSLGASLVLNSTDVAKDTDQFIDRLKKYSCSVWTSTPSFTLIFLRHPLFNADHIPSMKTFLFMGEELPTRTCSSLMKLFPQARIMNAYGPTEATIVTTLVTITEEILSKYSTVPIGFPMTGSRLLIDGDPAKTAEGELYIIGPHVASGYYKDEELSSGKFFTDGEHRGFKTGDLAYYEDGMLFFLGRNDDQVKLHGYRIELNEISNVICRNEHVTEAVTIPLKRGNEVRKLITFITVTKGAPDALNETVMKDLEATLPYYMIPSEIIVTDEFPYTSSHKIDRKKLTEKYLQQQ